MKHKKTKLTEACKELMHFRPDLRGFSSKKSAPAIPTPKLACKTCE